VTVYPVTPSQFKKVTGRPPKGERGRIAVIHEVASLLPQFIANNSGRALGVDIKDGVYSEKRNMHGSRAKIQSWIESNEGDLLVKKCVAFFHSKQLDSSDLDVKSLLDPILVSPCYFTIHYILTKRISDELMGQLEDNLLLLKETRKQVTKEKRRKKAEIRSQTKYKSEAEDVAQAVLLLKQHGLDVVSIAKGKP